jgi:hypothetical protein
MLAEAALPVQDEGTSFALVREAGLAVERDGAVIRVGRPEGLAAQLLRAQITDATCETGAAASLRLIAYNLRATVAEQRLALAAALSAAFEGSPRLAKVRLDPTSLPGAALAALVASGVLDSEGVCLREAFFFQPARPTCRLQSEKGPETCREKPYSI